MKLSFQLFISIVCLLLLPLVGFAQDAAPTQSVDLGDGYSISLPLDWGILKGGGIATARGGGIVLKILTPAYIDTLGTSINAETNVVDALVTLDALPPRTVLIDKANVQKARYADRFAAVYNDSSDSSTDVMDIVISMSGGSPGYLTFSSDTGILANQKEIVDAIITSFEGGGSSGNADANPTQAPQQSLGISEANSGTNSSTDNGGAAATGGNEVNCTVSADANTAQLRVGPGTNRGAISFLPGGVDVTVTGRIVLKDNSVWYQLDKSEAAPKGTSAAELWVSADQVTASGDCDHVGDASAPPVIPGNVAPPPTNNSQGGDQGNSGDQGNATPGALPSPGRWTITYNATTNVSCQGTRNVPVNSSEVFASLTYVFFLDGVDANSFKYGGDLFTRVPGTNSFNGSFTFADGSNTQARYDVISPTLMTGQEVGNVTVDGTPCSATVLVTLTKN